MKLTTGLNPSEFGSAAEISLDGNELAEAIFDYVKKNDDARYRKLIERLGIRR